MPPVGFKGADGVDLGDKLVPKSYLIDRYPELVDNFRFAGLWTWGYNNRGQLGTNNVNNYYSPVQTIASGANWKQVASGGYHTAAIKTDGTLWLWGYNNGGQLGTNNIVHRSSPVQTIAGGTNWKQVACGTYHTAAIKTDGTLWLWGNNDEKQLGKDSVYNFSSPIQITGGGTNWKQVACGWRHSAAIKTDGSLWVWGGNLFGQLGTGDRTQRNTPWQISSGGINWKLIACGGYNTAAIKVDGSLWGWGSNWNGELATNDAAHRSSPVQTIAGGTNWKQLTIGAAIKTDGTLWTWGYNGQGQLGTNDTTTRYSPVQTISGGTNWKQVAGSTAIKTDGTLWLWGSNGFGQLGTNDITNRSSPVQTVAGGTNWKQVAGNVAIRDNSNDYI